MGKLYNFDNLNLEFKNNEITSILGDNNNQIVKNLKDKYKIITVDNLFNNKDKLVEVMIPAFKKNEYIIKSLGLKNLFSKKYGELGIEEKSLVMIISSLLVAKDIIIFNDVLSYLDNKTKQKIINYIKRHKLTLINFTSDIEETLLSDNVIIIKENKIILSGRTLDVLKNEKQLKLLGISLPFVVDLSIQLGLYELIKKIYVSNKKLIGDLWK